MQIGKNYCILIMIFIVITFSLLVSTSQSFIPLIIHVEMFFWQLKYSTFMRCFDEAHQRKSNEMNRTTQKKENNTGDIQLLRVLFS